MSALNPDTWTGRYREALQPEVIKQRATVRGTALQGLDAMPIEVACSALQHGLKATFLATVRCCELIRCEVERALDHAQRVYADPREVLKAGYWGFRSIDPYTPTLFTGPAGGGKTQLRLAIGRVLNGRRELWIDESHPRLSLTDYVECVAGSQKSITGVLRPLAGPEIAAGRVRVKEAELPGKCARWQRICGVCLLGADEMQFMTQSDNASTLVTRTMLAIADVQLPWFAMTNYSLCWKLLARPAEATQRLLGRPTILLPDSPDSEDWKELLSEYEVIAGEAFAFKLTDHPIDLWNLSAGLKRELVKLLVHSYRVARRCGATGVQWQHVLLAFASVEFSVPRRDINLLIAYAAQGGELRKDLECPFTGTEVDDQKQAYSDKLRQARTAKVAEAVIVSAMTASEKQAIAGIKELSSQAEAGDTAQVIPIKRRGKPSLEGLLEAGRRARERRCTPPAEV